LRFISLSLRRTSSTPRATRFARLDLGLFTKSSKRMTFYESINICSFELIPYSVNLTRWERHLAAIENPAAALGISWLEATPTHFKN
jgi:hypothetical protein